MGDSGKRESMSASAEQLIKPRSATISFCIVLRLYKPELNFQERDILYQSPIRGWPVAAKLISEFADFVDICIAAFQA